jgi:hypothetical protein
MLKINKKLTWEEIMTFKYVNRKNLVYYLQTSKTEAGETEYFFSRQRQDNDIAGIPDGYKIYEESSGKVILKKIPQES